MSILTLNTLTEYKMLCTYIADYIMEEQARGVIEVDTYLVQDAIQAYLGGAAND
jgi:hypothetical protein